MKTLYKNLMNLVANDDAKFFFRDAVTSIGTNVRVFSYHVASYNDWLLPDALEARGIMFEMKDDEPVRIMSRPMQKFFNLNENPLTMNLDLSKILYVMTKEDGSLISTFEDQGYLFLKSKTSVSSDQVYQASAWLSMSDREKFRAALRELALADFTVNMEWVSPQNRIVLGYNEPKLVVLNIRHNITGEYMSPQEIFRISALREYVVNHHDVEFIEKHGRAIDWVEFVRKQEAIEGYVVVMTDNMFKLKTNWYCSLHHTKDSVNSNQRLWECCAENATDDLRQMFEADKVSLSRIERFDELYANSFSYALHYVRSFYDKNRGHDRKTFAIAAQVATKEHDQRHLFGLIMNTFNGFDSDKMINDIKSVLVKNWELFVGKDDDSQMDVS
ncbi:MAG: hypothetical protein [Caudoviricetes sp.]|nr:MAG: hypothetical protein [Caudoviricetes sp.]